jgi:flagellar capping protein FliD
MSYFTISYPIDIHTADHTVDYNKIKNIINESVINFKNIFKSITDINDYSNYSLEFDSKNSLVTDCIVYDRYGSISSDEGAIYKTYGLIFKCDNLDYFDIIKIIKSYFKISQVLGDYLNNIIKDKYIEKIHCTISTNGDNSLEKICGFLVDDK